MNPKRRGPAGVRGSTAASGGNREKPAPQRSERGKAAQAAADRVPGTARGPAKQVQIPPSPPKTPNAFAFGVFLFYFSLFTKAARHRGMKVKSEEVGCAAEHFFHMRACFLWKIRGRRRAAAVPENIPRKPGRKKAAEKSPGSPAKSPVDQRLLCQNSSSS